MSIEQELDRIARELKRIREALDRAFPPPPKDKKPAHETRRVWTL